MGGTRRFAVWNVKAMIGLILLRGRHLGGLFEMGFIARLLERKRTLVDLKYEETDRELVAGIERRLKEIDDTLTSIETEQAPPTAPEQVRPMSDLADLELEMNISYKEPPPPLHDDEAKAQIAGDDVKR